ncbi:hypothetical protein WJX84_000430 [Apatococcus fuscideae]|uniref:Protein kinase domain-containing protein n=1 Tax=Apatococcus fuscideae TaxID=2026836 RepID=A0AAW1T654_9CHLO
MRYQALWLLVSLQASTYYILSGQEVGPYINLINKCNYPILVDVGALNGTSYPNAYELAPSGTTDAATFQTITLAGQWPNGLAYVTRVNGTVATQVHLDIPIGGSFDTYHIDLQSGYSVPADIEPYGLIGNPAQGLTCCPRYCSISNVNAICQAPDVDDNGACENVDGTGSVATAATRAFKNACPSASTFVGDTMGANGASVNGSCGRGTNYNINFCPSAPGVCPAPPAPAPGAQPVAQGKSSSSDTGAIAGGVVGGVVGAALVLLIAFLLARRQQKGKQRRQEPHLMPQTISSPWDPAPVAEKPKWYQRWRPSPKPSASSLPTESGMTIDSSQSSLQLTGGSKMTNSGFKTQKTSATAGRRYFPSLPQKGSIAFDDLGIEQLGQADVRSQLASSVEEEEWELPKGVKDDLEKIWMIDSKQLQVAVDDTGQPVMLGKGAYGTIEGLGGWAPGPVIIKVFKGTLGVRTVAIKVIHNNSSKEQARFVREIATLRALHDPNIVMFLGASLQRNKTMLVMEYLPNGNLWDALRADTQGKLGWYGRGRRIALDVAAGMAYLHSKRIVHLDLKTPNILLDEHQTARVADIGLGKTLAGVDVKASSATFLWAAPEQLQALPCTEAADVFSFGVILWEICSGEPPLQRSMRKLRVPGECPQTVVDLISRCVSIDPAARPRMDEAFTILEATLAK